MYLFCKLKRYVEVFLSSFHYQDISWSPISAAMTQNGWGQAISINGGQKGTKQTSNYAIDGSCGDTQTR